MSAADVTVSPSWVASRRPSLWVQIPELARRSVMRTIRQPAAIIPATTFPLILLAINSVGLKSATSLPGFPTDSYVTFALSFAFIQAGVFAVIGTGQNLAEDNQGGFFNRLSALGRLRIHAAICLAADIGVQVEDTVFAARIFFVEGIGAVGDGLRLVRFILPVGVELL